MKEIPVRFAPYFRHFKATFGPAKGDTQPETFMCLRCLQHIKPNSLGAQSHLMKHCRTIERARGQRK